LQYTVSKPVVTVGGGGGGTVVVGVGSVVVTTGVVVGDVVVGDVVVAVGGVLVVVPPQPVMPDSKTKTNRILTNIPVFILAPYLSLSGILIIYYTTIELPILFKSAPPKNLP
jgi:hypothetical protein